MVVATCFLVWVTKNIKPQPDKSGNIQVPAEMQIIYSGIVTELKPQIVPGPHSILVLRVKRIFEGIRATVIHDVLMPRDPVYVHVRPSVGDTVYFCLIPICEQDYDGSRSNPIIVKMGLYVHPDLVAEVLKKGTAKMAKD